jgi:hypothetical protein
MADDERHTRPSPTDEMVQLGGDPHRLLRGEDPETEYADDARHWIAVYHELLGFKQDMLRTAREDMARISESAQQEVLDTDLPVMEAEARRFQHRIRFWEGRLEELEGARRGSGRG